ncbi:MAG: AMIN domain-containing protein, partial [Psychrobacter sp.]
MTVRNNKVTMMSNRVSSAFAISALAISMVAVSNSAHAAQRINDVSVVQTAPAVTQIRLGFSGSPVLPAAYQLDDPSRLVLDFEQVQNGLASRFSEYNTGIVNDLTTLSSDSTTRLIVGLKQTGSYTTTIDGNDLVLTITDPNGSVMTSDPVQDVLNNNVTTTPIVEASSGYTANTSSQTVTENQVPADTMVVRVNPLLSPQLASSQVSKQYSYEGLSAVDFSAGNDGGGNVSIALNNEAIPVDVQRQGNKLVVYLTGSTVPRNLLRRLNINSGLVNSIDTKNQGQNGVITINMTDDYEYQAYQSGNQLNISINKPALLREPTLEEKVYSGEPLSMEFQDVEIRSVLDILAQFTEMNIVANDSVAGNITLRLINVPWDQALDIILKSKNLGKRENGNVILVAPATELAEQEARELEA